jgi:predicted metal-dependent hydrolase
MQLHSLPYEVSYRVIKYPRLEFKTGRLLLILPFGYETDGILDKHRSWILKKAEFIKECLKEVRHKKIVQRTEGEFKDSVLYLVKKNSRELGEDLNRIYFRTMKTKWASCTGKRNLMINRLMKYLPDHLIEYVVFHEMAHLRDKRHNNGFWKRISKKFGNYKELERDLFIYWFQVANKVVSKKES